MANKKITELSALTEADANDLLVIVDDPSGSPETKKIAVSGFLPTNLTDSERIAAVNYGFSPPTVPDATIRAYVGEYTKLSKIANWAQMSMSTAQGGAPVFMAYEGVAVDGRYIYFVPYDSNTFIRFDTQGTSFTTAGDWEQMSMSTAQGGAPLDNAYLGATFDGRYIYYAADDSNTFIRFDTQGTSFTTAGDWEQMSMSTAQGGATLDSAYVGVTYDGRYVYYTACCSNTFIRFDTQGTSFTTAGDWEQMSMSTAQGGATSSYEYRLLTFDGRYVYFIPSNSDTFIRFDTQGTSFTTAGDWEQMSMSTAQGGAPLGSAYDGASFDGRYVYFVARNSDTFIRFDTQGTSFTTAGDWEQMSMSTAQGGATLNHAYLGATFDGRYIYYSPLVSNTLLKFDTQGTSFTTAGDWEQMSMSTAQGGAPVVDGYVDTIFDGHYIYLVAHTTDTFLRFSGMNVGSCAGK